MCRHFGYIGPVRPIGDLVGGAANSLVRQSWAPREMRGGGVVNADGFGLAWWVEGKMLRYRSVSPMWSDPAVPEMLAHLASGSVVAAVRSATEGMPIERSATAPLVAHGWAFSHNGVVVGWPTSVDALVGDVPASELLALESPTDSVTLWMLLRRALRGAQPGSALAALVTAVAAAAPGSRLNLLLSNGQELWATAWDHSLYTRVDESSVWIASEPFDDDPQWLPVPDRHLVYARPGLVDLTPLERTSA